MNHSFKVGDLVKVITLSDLGVIDRQKVLNPNTVFAVVDVSPNEVALHLPCVSNYPKKAQRWWLLPTEVRLSRHCKLEYRTFKWG